MIKQNKHYFIPDTHDAIVWRYFTLGKLESLLKEKALYFARADLLGDDHEGSVSDETIKNRPLFYSGASENFINNSAPENAKNVAKCVYVSCWHLNPSESVAMWNQYVNEGKGVALKTKVSQIKKGILDTNTEFLLGEVKYVDYVSFPISEWSVFEPFFYKQNVHSHESEFRIIKESLEDLGTVASGNKVPAQGVFVSVDLNLIIEGLVISPYANKDFEAKVKAMIAEYGFEDKIFQSSVLRQPTF